MEENRLSCGKLYLVWAPHRLISFKDTSLVAPSSDHEFTDDQERHNRVFMSVSWGHSCQIVRYDMKTGRGV
jgi:hypothetical protein